MNIILYKQFNLFNDTPIPDFIYENQIMIYDNINNINFEKKYNIIIWHYNNNNIRIPYDENNNKIQYIKLNNDNIYDFISHLSFVEDNNIICGEKIQFLADVVVGTIDSLNWNPNNKYFSKELKTIEQLNDLSKYNSIFVFTHDLELFYNKFQNQINDKIIISHNSDHEISFIKNIKLHLAQNCLITNPKLISLPIGIENNQWFDHNIFHKVRNMNIKKTKNIYFFFNLNTHKSRINCYEILANKLQWNEKKSKEEYFIELAKHKYCICPRGNGLDTHRLYECLYLNVIPIVIKDDFININNLPIIILNNWNDLDEHNLINSFYNLNISKLTVNYYKNIIYKE
jgi:hypothetical protein